MTYNCFRVMPYNYISLDGLANTDVTSENPSYPIENAYNKQRRSKLWKSAGYFNVTSSNNGIVFKESGAGATLTASIVVGEYTSIAALQTAIKTAMDLVGISTYTITQTNYEFTITTGGAYLSLFCSDVGFTMADLIGFDTVDRTGATSYIADEIRIHEYEQIVWDMGVSTAPDIFTLTGPRNSSLKFSPTATIKLYGNETNDFTTPSYETTLVHD